MRSNPLKGILTKSHIIKETSNDNINLVIITIRHTNLQIQVLRSNSTQDMTVLQLIKKIDHKGFNQDLTIKIQDMIKEIGSRITKIQDLGVSKKLMGNKMENEDDMTEDIREVQNFLTIHTWVPLKVGHGSKMIHIRTSQSKNRLEIGKLFLQEAKVQLFKRATSQKVLIKRQTKTITHLLRVITPLRNLANQRVILNR